MSPGNKRHHCKVAGKAPSMATAFILLCLMNMWTLQVLSDPLHRHYVIAQSPEHSEEPTPSIQPTLSTESPDVSYPLVNQHALLQIHVSVDCTLGDLFPDKESSMLYMDTSWFVMITELPHTDIPTDSTIHLDQAVDLTWVSLESGVFAANASLSFLIPLSANVAAERTLIVTLMEHSRQGHSRIATRRLANLPMNGGSWTMKQARTNPLVSVDLSTSATTCATKSRHDDDTPDKSTQYGKSYGVVSVLLFGILVYVYPRKAVEFEEEEEEDEYYCEETVQEESVQNIEGDDQVSASPAKLSRGIAIESPSSDEQDWSVHDEREGTGRACDSRTSNSLVSRPKSKIIKPPSLVRIPYAFVTEEVGGEDSTLSVESTDQRSVDVGGNRQDAFPSPVVDADESVKGNTKHRGSKANEKTMDESDTPADTADKTSTASKDQVTTGDPGGDAFHSPAIDPSPVMEIELDGKKVSTTLPKNSFKTPQMVGQGDGEPESRENKEQGTSTCENKIGHQSIRVSVSTAALNSSPCTVDEELFQENAGNDMELLEKHACKDTTGRKPSSEKNIREDSSDEASKVPGAPSAIRVSTNTDTAVPQSDIDQPSTFPIGLLDPLVSKGHSNLSVEMAAELLEAVSDQGKTRPSVAKRKLNTNEGTNRVVTVAASVNEGSGSRPLPPSSNSGDLTCNKKRMSECDTPNVSENSAAAGDNERKSKQQLHSKVIDIDFISMDETNWLRRLRDCPAAVQSSSAVAKAGPSARDPPGATNDQRGEKSEEGFKDEDLSYVSTLPPDSDSNDGAVDDFPVASFDYSPERTADSPPKENMPEPDIISRPPRRKRRLGTLKARNIADQFPMQSLRPDMADTRKSKSPSKKSTAAAAQATSSTRVEEAKPARQKKPAMPTVVPDVVPSTFLQSFAKQIDAPVPWDFTKTSSRHEVERENQPRDSRHRKRKSPPSTIVLNLPGNQLSVISRGSSRVPPRQQKSQDRTMGKTPSTISRKRRRLKKLEK